MVDVFAKQRGERPFIAIANVNKQFVVSLYGAILELVAQRNLANTGPSCASKIGNPQQYQARFGRRKGQI